MTSNPYQSPTTVSPPAPAVKRVRWPFLLDLALCFAAGVFAVVLAFITNFIHWQGNWDNPLALVGRFLPQISLCVAAVGNIFARQERAAASLYLKLAALLLAAQIPMILHTISLTIVDDPPHDSFAELEQTIAASESVIMLALLGGRIIYNTIFYYWAIRQARSSPVTG